MKVGHFGIFFSKGVKLENIFGNRVRRKKKFTHEHVETLFFLNGFLLVVGKQNNFNFFLKSLKKNSLNSFNIKSFFFNLKETHPTLD